MLAPSLAPSWGPPVPNAGFTPTPSPSPSPSPTPIPGSEDVTPGPTGHPEYVTVKGGPIRSTPSATCRLARKARPASYGGIATGATPTPTSSPQNVIQVLQNNNTQTASASAGLTAGITRRTATTVTSISIPLNVCEPGCSEFGATRSVLLDATVHDSVRLAADHALRAYFPPLGPTQRMLPPSFSPHPTEFGDVTFFEGPAIGAEAELIHLYGVRIRDVAGQTFYELGVTTGDGHFHLAFAHAHVRSGHLEGRAQFNREGSRAGADGR